jgi:hypothetical protein
MVVVSATVFSGVVNTPHYKPEGRGFDSRVGFLRFFGDLILLAALWHSASNRNEYRRFSMGGKDGRCIGLTTLPPSCADCLEILGTSTSWIPWGLCRPVQGQLYLTISQFDIGAEGGEVCNVRGVGGPGANLNGYQLYLFFP